MDTGYGLRGRGELFHVGWCFVADDRMDAGSIVEDLEEAEEGGSGVLAGQERPVLLELGFETAEEALHWGIDAPIAVKRRISLCAGCWPGGRDSQKSRGPRSA